MADPDPAEEQQGTPKKKEVTIHYIKSGSFRAVHCDGVMGGASPDHRDIHAAIFSQRHPIPVQTIHELDGNVLGREVSRVVRSGIVRDVEVDIVMSIETAEAVATWLNNWVSECRKHLSKAQEQPS